MRRLFFVGLLLSTFFQAATQSTVSDGVWTAGSTWSGGNSPGTTGLGSNNITVDHNVTVSNSAEASGLTFAQNNKQRSFVSSDTLLIYGDVLFNKDAMGFVISSGAVIIIGNLTIQDKLVIESDGTLVVTGDFNMTGNNSSNLDYEGTGTVYAGSYSGYADAIIPGDNNNTDQQQTIQDLETDVKTNPALQDIINTINENTDATLPVTLGEFNYESGKETVVLRWVTYSEINFDHFEIQHADQSGNFIAIGTVPGHGTSKSTKHYSWTDEYPMPGLNYYRLVSIDYDGYQEVFKSVAVLFTPQLEGFKIYPNPAYPGKDINITTHDGQSGLCSLFNVNGELVIEETARESFILPSSLMPGIYVLQVNINGWIRRKNIIIR